MPVRTCCVVQPVITGSYKDMFGECMVDFLTAGKKMFTRSDSKLAAQREPQINDYTQKLVALPPKVSHSELVIEFFMAHEGDPSFEDASGAVSASYIKDGEEESTMLNKGFKRLSQQGSDDEGDTRDDEHPRMRKVNSSEALLTERERTVSQTIVEIHNPIMPPQEKMAEKDKEDEEKEETKSSEKAALSTASPDDVHVEASSGGDEES